MPNHRKHFVCVIEGCDEPHQARGWCKTHYNAWYAHGDPRLISRRAAPDANSYYAVHSRLKKRWGSPDRYRCVLCGTCASQWACWRNKSECRNERKGGRIVPYSVNIEDYAPLCWECHRDLDANNQGEFNGNVRLTEDNVHEIRRRSMDGESCAAIAVDVGVHRRTVYDVLTGKTWTWLK